MAKLEELGDRVNIVLIGGRYTPEQRQRIRAWVAEHIPLAKIAQPAYNYLYSNEAIFTNVKGKL